MDSVARKPVGIYYDPRLERAGMEFLYGVKEDIKSFLNSPQVEGLTFTQLDYDTVQNFVKTLGILIMLQDVIPYTLFDAEYIDLFSLSNNLGRFLNAGGILLWMGDVPFFYRLRCYEKGKLPSDPLSQFREKNKWMSNLKFMEEHLHFTEVDERTCFRDIIGTSYITPSMDSRYMPFRTEYLKFLDLSGICYSEREVDSNPTIVGKLLGYSYSKAMRPVKASHNLIPLSTTKLDFTTCRGTYYPSWIREVGKGYFVRVLDHPSPGIEEVRGAVDLVMKLGRVQGLID
ncbi:hypothetical protein [Metallosphaera javensis (ex Sakai et al. 2022)]|uniref:hypothetical protein n=1 Tax=Metallosphaera javensis (ex Sakai et al. 2022) TaxID=2775498 RepID=UPI00258C3976|nr:MAG: hypothetical protein MjAS7_1900 [Metallosphaera javensis (ex Sakai et al. 2022)]